MRGLFSKAHPRFDWMLVIESGPRPLTEEFLAHVYQVQRSRHVDLLTCFEGVPATFQMSRGAVYRTDDAATRANRRRLLNMLSRAPYTAVAIFCTGSPILAKWKWMIALRTRAKVVIVNEHAGFFALDFQHRHTAKLMLSQRLHIAGMDLRIVPELLLVPFTITYLVLYAAAVHGRRLLRTQK